MLRDLGLELNDPRMILEKAVGSACRVEGIDLKSIMKKCVVTLLVIRVFSV